MADADAPLKIAVIYGSVRSARQGIKAARFVAERCAARGEEVTLVDPLDYPLPLLDRMYKEYQPGTAPATLEALAGIIRPADGYLVVSGEYNHTVPPALANLLDHFLEEYFFKPSGIVCYSAGSFGGVRAAMTLRAMLAEMGMSSIPSLLPVPRVGNAFDDHGTPNDDAWYGRAQKFLDEFCWYARALRAARAQRCERGHCDGGEQQAGAGS